MSELSKAVEFIPNAVYYLSARSSPKESSSVHYFSIDRELVFWNFYLDFGPLNMAQTYRFAEMLHRRIDDPRLKGKKICLYSGTHGNRRANAVCLMACWGIMYRGMTPEEAFCPFENEEPFPPFHDATAGVCTFNLSILDCLRGLAKAIKIKYFNVLEFNVDEYEHYERVENGDLTILSPKFIAFAGPKDKKVVTREGYYQLTPEDYIPYMKKCNVTLVIRLNQKCYDEEKFRNAGIDHLSLIYPDGSNAPPEVLKRFITACEKTPGTVAVHCKAGLGRTGTCIGSYMMKHNHFTAHEVIGWLRLCRPGSVIGPQQQYLEQLEPIMWRAGQDVSSLTPMLPKLSINSNSYVESSDISMKTQGDDLVTAKRKQQQQQQLFQLNARSS